MATVTIDEWVAKSNDRMLAVAKEATQRTVALAQDRIPRDTGFARASIRASDSSMPQIDPGSHGEKGKTYTYDPGQITVAIASLELGGAVYVGWTASYVPFLELGHSKQAPTGFVGLAAEAWPVTVNQVVQELKARSGQ